MRTPDPIRQAWQLRFGLSYRQARRLTDKMLWRLSQCRNDEARRIILGVSR
jgi:hypothetical protein